MSIVVTFCEFIMIDLDTKQWNTSPKNCNKESKQFKESNKIFYFYESLKKKDDIKDIIPVLKKITIGRTKNVA